MRATRISTAASKKMDFILTQKKSSLPMRSVLNLMVLKIFLKNFSAMKTKTESELRWMNGTPYMLRCARGGKISISMNFFLSAENAFSLA